MFTDEMRERGQSEICLNGVSATGLQGLLEYAYTSRLCLNLANILDILAAAAHFQVLAIIQACSNYLQVRKRPEATDKRVLGPRTPFCQEFLSFSLNENFSARGPTDREY